MSSRDPHTVPSDSAKSQAAAAAAAPERTDSDETCPSQPSDSPSPPQTETPTDSDPPQVEGSESDRPEEPVSHPPQPIREVTLLLLSSACSFPASSCLSSHRLVSDHDHRAFKLAFSVPQQ